MLKLPLYLTIHSKKLSISSLAAFLAAIHCNSAVYANEWTWKEAGGSVTAQQQPSATGTKQSLSLQRKSTDATISVTLASGEAVKIIGGIFVKTDDEKSLTDWLDNANLAYTEDPHIDHAFIVAVSPSSALRWVGDIAKLQGVTTAAPIYRQAIATQ